MTNTKIRALAGASALLLSGALAATAHADAVVYGGGSTLSAPYVRSAEDCFGVAAPLYTPGKPAVNVPSSEVFTTTVGGVAHTTDCIQTNVDPHVTFNLEASGSGAGVLAFFDHNPAGLGTYIAVDGTTGHTFPAEHYGTSDTAMGEADVAVYNNGGDVDPATGKSVHVVAPGVTPDSTHFANPAATYGPMVQLPLLITPITVAYSPVYKKVGQADGSVKTYSFNITNPANKGALRLDLVTYCKIFNGQITDWNDPAIAALNGKPIKVKGVLTGYTPLNDPADPDVVAGQHFSVPIELVGRSDGSGTTSIFSRALAAQCSGLSGVTNNYPDAASTLPSAMIAASASPGSGKFTVQSGSGGVAGYMAFTAVPAAGAEVVSGKLAYLSPDYVGPVNSNYGLVAAALANYTTQTKFVLPTAKTALASFNGLVNPPTGADAADPANWVQAPSKSAAIATPTSATGYPIVGTTQILAYTCYADTAAGSTDNVGYKMNQFLSFYLKNPLITAAGGILELNGFAPMPPAFRTAEYNTFVKPNSSNLYVSPKSDLTTTTTSVNSAGKTVTKTKITFAHNPACNAVAGG